MRSILAVVGSRAAAVRIAPLVRLLRRVPSMSAVVCIASPLAAQIAAELAVFGIEADEVLDRIACQSEQDIGRAVAAIVRKRQSDCVLVQGDATAVMGAFRRQAAFGNLGSGLRLYELHHHDADTVGEALVDLVATCYFVASEAAREQLCKEGVAPENIYVTDSTAVDALMLMSERISSDRKLQDGLAAAYPHVAPDRRLVYVACQRCDCSVERFEAICRALKRLAMRPDVQVVCPAHPEPGMRRIADEVFADHPQITVIEPPDYLHHVYLMQTAYLILSDSDDTCDEVLALGKPVLVMRGAGEGLNGDDIGSAKLVGAETADILRECTMFLDDEAYYQAFTARRSRSADGQASQRIVETMLR
jgi:UDP-N-acetylglucosamine 2-epimerase (non-hydrolysing)